MNRIFKELQRRNVVKVAMAYLAVAWLVLQLVGEIGPILDMPAWVPRLVLGLLAGGFVITVVLAWIFEITESGLRTTEEVDSDDTLRPVQGRVLNFVIIGALAMALGYFIWESRFAREAAVETAVRSIAVLPFEDMSEDGDQAHFADGMAEELLNRLARSPDLRVAGRTSSFSFRDSDKDVRGIAAELGVSHVLEGSVRTSGARLRVSARLLEADRGFQLWSRTFDRELSDVFAVQDEIAAAVITGLEVHIDGAGSATLTESGVTRNMQAYNEYLLGRHELARRSAPGLRAALVHFRQAVAADPGYSPAWSALGKTLVVSPYYEPLAEPAELAAQAREAATRAARLDADNSEAYAVLGTVRMMFDRDWAGAGSELRRSVDLHPHHAGNVNLYGDFLYMTGDYRAALVYEGLAAELEPLSAVHQHELALVLGLLGRLPEAIEMERLAVRLNPGFANAWSSLIRMLLEAGFVKEARAVLEQQRGVLGQRREGWTEFRLFLHDGDREAARRAAEDVHAITRLQGHSLAQVAWMYASLGDDAAADGLLGEAIDASDPLLNSPLYFFLPEDWAHLPRLRARLERSGLRALYELRRRHRAAGAGRAPPRAGRVSAGSSAGLVSARVAVDTSSPEQPAR